MVVQLKVGVSSAIESIETRSLQHEKRSCFYEMPVSTTTTISEHYYT